MNDTLTLIEKLNAYLEVEELDEDLFEDTLDQILNSINHKIKIRLINIEFYRDRMEYYRAEKVDAVNAQRFEYAAACRDHEKEYLKHLELMKEYDIEKSMFYLEKYTLFYFYLGTAKNDAAINGLLKE
jgi:hypothetical protein